MRTTRARSASGGAPALAPALPLILTLASTLALTHTLTLLSIRYAQLGAPPGDAPAAADASASGAVNGAALGPFDPVCEHRSWSAWTAAVGEEQSAALTGGPAHTSAPGSVDGAVEPAAWMCSLALLLPSSAEGRKLAAMVPNAKKASANISRILAAF